jgi:hypothetical protein
VSSMAPPKLPAITVATIANAQNNSLPTLGHG